MMLTEPLQSLRQCPSTQVRATAHDQSSGFAPSVGVDYLNALPSVDCHLLIYSPAWGKHIWVLTPVYPGRGYTMDTICNRPSCTTPSTPLAVKRDLKPMNQYNLP